MPFIKSFALRARETLSISLSNATDRVPPQAQVDPASNQMGQEIGTILLDAVRGFWNQDDYQKHRHR